MIKKGDKFIIHHGGGCNSGPYTATEITKSLDQYFVRFKNERGYNMWRAMKDCYKVKNNTTKNPKILILGHGRHGKDEVARILVEKFHLKSCSSSWFCAERVIYPQIASLAGYKNVEECYSDRHNHRKLWKTLISAYNSPDKSKLAREILEENDIYVGLRCKEEFEASKHLFDLILYVDASKRVEYLDPTYSIGVPKNSFIINNNSNIEQLERVVQHFYSSYLENTWHE